MEKTGKVKKNFLLLSLDDEKTKAIANTVSNSTCKKILEFLAENDGTETEISKTLGIPISTVHYNLKQLLEARLVEWDNYHLSEKGKEVKHYTLANKYIIIAPKGADKASFLEAVKNIIPVFGLGVLGTFFASKFSGFDSSSSFGSSSDLSVMGGSEMMTKNVVPEAYGLSNSMMYDEVAPNSALMDSSNSVSLLDYVFDFFSSFSSAEWFLFGFVFAISSIWLSKKINKKFFKKKSNEVL